MTSLVRHLHGFIRDVLLTESEWNAAIAFLAEVWHITDDHRQEFIILSNVLSASIQTISQLTEPLPVQDPDTDKPKELTFSARPDTASRHTTLNDSCFARRVYEPFTRR